MGARIDHVVWSRAAPSSPRFHAAANARTFSTASDCDG